MAAHCQHWVGCALAGLEGGVRVWDASSVEVGLSQVSAEAWGDAEAVLQGETDIVSVLSSTDIQVAEPRQKVDSTAYTHALLAPGLGCVFDIDARAGVECFRVVCNVPATAAGLRPRASTLPEV